MTMNFNVSPFYDDYDETKGFYKILFRPGHAVQARELTQLQTMLQAQVERLGTHIFKDGAKVLDASFGYDNNFHAVKLASLYENTSVDDYLDQFVNLQIMGETTGVIADVVTYTRSTETDPPTLYVKYISTGYDKVTTVFADDESIVATQSRVYTYEAGQPSLTTAAFNCNAIGATANIERGIFYTLGHFVFVDAQRVILSKYTNTPSARIGLLVKEHIIDADTDSTLLDNAQGTSNFAAPGANRYAISLTLTAYDPEETITDKFIELERVNNGRLLAKVRTSPYSVLEDNIAKRTYDTNGDFIVNRFRMQMKESVKNATNNGVWQAGDTTDDGNIASEDLMALQLSEGKAYVKGYTIETTQPTFIDVPKPRDFEEVKNSSFTFELGNYTTINNVFNLPDIVAKQGNAAFDPYTPLYLSDAPNTTPGSSNGNLIGVARAKSIEYSDAVPVGNTMLATDEFKLYLFDIKMLSEIVLTGAVTVTAGSKITGQFSKATGYVYINSSTNSIMLVGVSGKFADNEPLYDSYSGNELANTVIEASCTYHSFDQVRQIYSANGPFTADLVQYPIYNTSGGTIGTSPRIFEQDKNLMVYKLPKDYIKTLETTSNGIPVTNLEFRREFLGQSNGLGAVPFTAGAGETFFNTKDNTIYQVSIVTPGTDLGNGIAPAPAGSMINVESADVALSATGGSVTITSDLFGDGADIRVFATLIRQDSRAKVKAPNIGSELRIIDKRGTPNVVYGTSSHHKEISLGVADVYKVRAVYTSGVAGIPATPPSLTTGIVTGAFVGGEQLVGQTSGTIATAINVTTSAGAATITYALESSEDFIQGETIVGNTTSSSAAITSIAAASRDIKDKYLLDTGQRDNFYDTSRLILKDGMLAPTGDLLVVFDYFDHNEGDFFSVDSYAGVDYSEIPYYSRTLIDLGKTEVSIGEFDLRSCIDFRPRVGNIPSAIDNGYKVITGSSFDFNSRNYATTSNQTSVINTLRDSSIFSYDYEYYLARKDALFLKAEGEFNYVQGVPAEFPDAPEDLNNALRIADISLIPYIMNIDEAEVYTHPAKRYTMKDISKLESRLSNVEYYTSLSLLEKEAASAQIKDVNGLDRFKAGFLVDPFTGHRVGDVNHLDYNCAIDMVGKTLRPKYVMKNIQLLEKDPVDSQRALAGYQVTGDIATLPYTDESIITQKRATKIENVNPSLVFGWIGNIQMSPSADTWFDIERLPAIVKNQNGTFDTIVAKNENSLGTVWDAPVTQWTGTTSWSEVEKSAPHSVWDMGPNSWGRPVKRQLVTSKETTIETGIQSRSGIDTDIVASVDIESQGDRLVGTSIIPFMRENTIYFEANGLKPNTRVYPFFDNQDVSKYVTSAGGSLIAKTGTTTTKQFTQGAWSSIGQVSVFYDNNKNSQLAFELQIAQSASGPFTSLGTTSTVGARTTNFDRVDFSIGGTIAAPNDFGELFVRVIVTRVDGTPISNKDDELSGLEISEIQVSSSLGASLSFDATNPNNTRFLQISDFYNINNPNNMIDGTINTDSDRYKASESEVPPSGKTKSIVTLKVIGGTATKTPTTNLQSYILPEDIDTTALVTDNLGKVAGLLHIPNPNIPGNPRFETGTTQFRLTSSPTNSKAIAETFANGTFMSKGVLNKVQETITATRNATVVSRDITHATAVSRSSSRITDQRFVDPLAQSFAIDIEGGCFLTKVDLFFQTKDFNLPCRVEIRTMENGVPTRTALPGSIVSMDPENINTSDDGSVPTTFVFNNPIYVEKDTELALVILSDSKNYNVFISQMGQNDILTNEYVSEQPYLGVLFKSQNASTWTAYDYEDLKFTLYRAKFEVGSGTITLENAPLPYKTLQSDPIQFFAGSNVVKVMHKNHQMQDAVNNTVDITNVKTGVSATLNGDILAGATTLLLDNVSNAMPADGTSYTFIIRASNQEQADEVIRGELSSTGLGVRSIINITNGVSSDYFDGTTIELYEVDGVSLEYVNKQHQLTFTGLDYYTITLDAAAGVPTQDLVFGGSEVLCSENAQIDSYQLMVPNFVLPGTSIDTSGTFRTSTYSTTQTGTIKPGIRYHRQSPCLVASQANEQQNLAANKSLLLNMVMTTQKDNISPVIDLERKTITCYANRLNLIEQESDVYPTQNYNPATVPSGDSGEAIYITRKVTLQTPATALKVILSALKYPSNKVSVMYKTQRADDTTDFDEVDWVYFNTDGSPDTAIPATETDTFLEHNYTVGDYDNPLPEFIAFAVKIKLEGTNTSKVPQVKDLRCIALAT